MEMDLGIPGATARVALLIQRLGLLELMALMALVLISSPVQAFDPLDPGANITITWDVVSWTADGYVANVKMHNYQLYRHIEPPGWVMGWEWTEREIIWSLQGAKVVAPKESSGRINCSAFSAPRPASCERNPKVADSSKKHGLLADTIQDPRNSMASFTLYVGEAGNTVSTVTLPSKFTLRTPGPGYVCGPAVKRAARPRGRPQADGRSSRPYMTWDVVCTYSQFLASTGPTCCVSLSAFDNKTHSAACPTCSCGCRTRTTPPSPIRPTSDMCPISLHWHVIQGSTVSGWLVKLTLLNRNYARSGYPNWNIVFQTLPHTRVQLKNVSGFQYTLLPTTTPLTPDGIADGIAMLWGLNDDNKKLERNGMVEGELLLQKLAKFPSRVYFNGDACVLPPPNAYPWKTST